MVRLLGNQGWASRTSCWSQADERSHAEEVVGDDEGKVGGEEEGVG